MAETTKKKSVFETLNKINVNDHTEQKNGLTYLSWAWAWREIKMHYPEATYTIYENADGLFYHTDGKTAWVKTGVTINGLEMIEYLPVMDFRNKSIPTDSITSFDVNKAIQRSLTKACARHGLGLYIYAGEDLPTETAKVETPEKAGNINLPTAEVFKEQMKGERASDDDVKQIIALAEQIKQPINRICESYNVKGLNDLTPSQIAEITAKLKGAQK